MREARLLAAVAVLASVALNGAALAEVKLSQANSPAGALGDQFALLLGAEHQAVEALDRQALSDLAHGPEAEEPKAPEVELAVAAPSEVQYDAGWLMAQPEPQGGAEWQCLTTALYFESRGESIRGQFAVAEVILNRVDSPLFPDTVCAVVHQGCQFSFVCDGYPERMREAGAAQLAGRIAYVMLNGGPRDLTAGATYFHTHAVSPSWSRRFARTTTIGAHLFYRQ